MDKYNEIFGKFIDDITTKGKKPIKETMGKIIATCGHLLWRFCYE